MASIGRCSVFLKCKNVKCREMQKNAEKCREMKRNVEKYREMYRNVEKSSEMQKMQKCGSCYIRY